MLLISFLIKAGLECSPFLKEGNFLKTLCEGGRKLTLFFFNNFRIIGNDRKSEQLKGTAKMFERGGGIKRPKAHFIE